MSIQQLIKPYRPSSIKFPEPKYRLHGNSFISFGAAALPVGGWVELDRTTLGGLADTISVSGLADKRYYMLLFDLTPDGGNIDYFCRCNNDTAGNNHAGRRSEDGAPDATFVSNNNGVVWGNSNINSPTFMVGWWSNLDIKEKFCINHTVQRTTAGAGTAPLRTEAVGKWANTVNPIDEFEAVNAGIDQYIAGSQVVVLGWSPTDVHTSNFWQELGSASGAGDDLDITTGLDKKYLFGMLYVEPSGTVDIDVTFNNDTATNYARRSNFNGGVDSTDINLTALEFSNNVTVPQWMYFYIINNLANEKLVIMHQVRQNTAGAANPPDRFTYISKWANTSAQISRIDVNNPEAGSYGANSFLKMWGSD